MSPMPCATGGDRRREGASIRRVPSGARLVSPDTPMSARGQDVRHVVLKARATSSPFSKTVFARNCE